ncbi:hypothetical protein LCGC14_2725190 [marine sediment metagenome]|uniref:Uncharacterized protein n=1 Tax=marine sediment metagenome TaxID=412755 RepID=A0A0F8Z900_9ZZZZ
MNTPLVVILFSWACHLSGYVSDDIPEIQFKPHAFFVEHVCGGRECSVEGWYNDKGIIYIDEQHKDMNSFAPSLVVHEMVHYLQPKDMDSCERERQAYSVQNLYIMEALASINVVMPKVCS